MGEDRRVAAPGTEAAVRLLLDRALEVYGGEPEAAAALRAQRRRLDEPLRVALVGRIKAGKSTLVNALVGERLAATDAGECTRVVTWYRNGSMPRVTLERVDGAAQGLPVRRVAGELRLHLGGTPPEEVARVVVDWPAAALSSTTLIDTPGLASIRADGSARTAAFVGAEEGPGADAVVFLTRQMQPGDLAFLGQLQAAAGVDGLHTTTLTVLSRADEVGSGRLDALLVAEETARRTAADPQVRALSQTVVAVAGLMGLGGRTMRHRDFVALQGLASTDDAELERLLLTADRFCRTDAPVPVAAEIRTSLLERLGLFGVRLSIALIRTGVADADTLADELVRRSGLAELQRLLAVRFTMRSGVLKSAAALRLVERLLRTRAAPGAHRLWGEIERIRLQAVELGELDLLARLRTAEVSLPDERQDEAERLLGGEGPDAADRLGLPADTPLAECRAAAGTALRRWRELGRDPRAPRSTVSACETVARTCEDLLAGLDEAASAPGAA